MSTKQVVHITGNETQAPLSPAQKKFNGLVKKIDCQKKLLAEWLDAFDQARQQAVDRLDPLRKTLCAHQVDMVNLLDQQFTSHKFTVNQQDKLSYLICEICEDLLQSSDGNEALKALYNKYSGGDYDAEVRQQQEMAADFVKTMFEREFGVSLEEHDFDLNDPNATAERLAEKIKHLQGQADAEQAPRPRRKKTAKQLAREAKEAEEAAKISKSIQAVYRQLTCALHPDREQDPVERERKTELMQLVTVAYGNRDLLKLLELQLSVEQIDQSKLNSIAADRLKHFNKILSDQLHELQEEVLLKRDEIRLMLGIDLYEVPSPKRLGMLLKQDIRALQADVDAIQSDMRRFRDVKQLKALLKSYRIPEPEFDSLMTGWMPFR